MNDTIPPKLAEVLKTFPFREPDRIVEGTGGEWLAEWHVENDNYFEIECTAAGKLEIMTYYGGEACHWTLSK